MCNAHAQQKKNDSNDHIQWTQYLKKKLEENERNNNNKWSRAVVEINTNAQNSVIALVVKRFAHIFVTMQKSFEYTSWILHTARLH